MNEFIDSIIAKGPFYLSSQILGIFIIVFCLFIYSQKDRDRIILFKFISDILAVIQLLLCGGFTGAGISAIQCFREIVFYNRSRHKWANHKIWPIIFIVIIALMPFITSNEPYFSFLWFMNIFPAIGSSLAVIGLYSCNANKTRFYSLIGILLWIIYLFIIHNWISILNNVISIISIIIGFVKDGNAASQIEHLGRKI